MSAALLRAAAYVRNHPQIFFVLILLIVFPFLFLYTGQQFLDVGRANQDTLQRQRIGLMNDVLSSLISVSVHDIATIQTEFDKLAQNNPDLRDYKVLVSRNSEIVPVIAMSEDVLGVPEIQTDLYRSAAVQIGESFIFEYFDQGDRMWDSYHAVVAPSGEMYFIHTQFSLQNIDEVFAMREQAAYFSLIFVYAFIIALAIWHIRLTDYRYLYIAAQKANQTKDLFTNMMAHELRAPLTAIRGYASMLAEKSTDEQHIQYASRIQDSSERLIAIVNDLLDVARLQSGKLSVEQKQVEVLSIVEAVLDELRVSAQSKDIKLQLEPTHNIGAVLADDKRLHQALTNLVSNAIKYTQQGTISLSLEDKPAYVELRVKDTGMGISAEDQQKLFAPFFRVKSTSVDKITGTGLGMWITKELIELMGGKISVESIKGVGTHIVVTLQKKEIK